MPRRPREEEPGAIHHVFDRGNNRQAIFRDDDDRETFLSLLGRACEITGWNCMGYCLMPNHFHLLIETPQPNLGTGMQRLLSPYAQIFHARHGSRDAVFGRRYGSKRVKDDVYLCTVITYIAMNPVAAGLCRGPAEWIWGSHAGIVRGAPQEWLAVDRLLGFLDRFGRDPARLYRDLVEGARGELTASPR